MPKSNVVITMAGFGKRFLDAGYTVPKYQVSVRGRTLFAWSMESLRSFITQGSPFVFIVRAADLASAFIRQEAQALGISSVQLIELQAPTDGQATTALAAKSAVYSTS